LLLYSIIFLYLHLLRSFRNIDYQFFFRWRKFQEAIMPATQKVPAQKIMFGPRSAAILVSLMGRKMHELSSPSRRSSAAPAACVHVIDLNLSPTRARCTIRESAVKSRVFPGAFSTTVVANSVKNAPLIPLYRRLRPQSSGRTRNARALPRTGNTQLLRFIFSKRSANNTIARFQK